MERRLNPDMTTRKRLGAGELDDNAAKKIKPNLVSYWPVEK